MKPIALALLLALPAAAAAAGHVESSPAFVVREVGGAILDSAPPSMQAPIAHYLDGRIDEAQLDAKLAALGPAAGAPQAAARAAGIDSLAASAPGFYRRLQDPSLSMDEAAQAARKFAAVRGLLLRHLPADLGEALERRVQTIAAQFQAPGDPGAVDAGAQQSDAREHEPQPALERSRPQAREARAEPRAPGALSLETLGVDAAAPISWAKSLGAGVLGKAQQTIDSGRGTLRGWGGMALGIGAAAVVGSWFVSAAATLLGTVLLGAASTAAVYVAQRHIMRVSTQGWKPHGVEAALVGAATAAGLAWLWSFALPAIGVAAAVGAVGNWAFYRHLVRKAAEYAEGGNSAFSTWALTVGGAIAGILFSVVGLGGASWVAAVTLGTFGFALFYDRLPGVLQRAYSLIRR